MSVVSALKINLNRDGLLANVDKITADTQLVYNFIITAIDPNRVRSVDFESDKPAAKETS
jgi:hypothetical protein